MKKLVNYLLIILLIISTIPANSYQTFAEELNAPVEKEAVLFADKESDEVEFYETVPEKEMEPFLMISDDTEVILLTEENEEEQPDNENEYLYIRYVLIDEEIEDVEKQETIYEGYVHHSNVVLKADADTYRDNRSEEVDEEDSNEEENSNQEDESNKEAPNQKEDPEAEKVEDQEDKEESAEDKEQENKEELDETEKQEEGKEEQNQQEDEAVKEPDDKTLKSESKSSRSLSLSSNDEIKNGDRDKKVIQLKKDLAKLGFPVPGNGTSLFGKQTQKQVKKFQKYYNITVTGSLTAETETKIKKVLSTPLQKGKRHKDTKQLKKDLAYIGMPVPGNGTILYGKDTEKIVKKFQKKYKLVQSGIAEDITLAKLKELKDTPLKNGMRREDVKTLKKNLAKLGFKVPGKGTTLFGKETEKQVKAFQKYYGLSQTGTVNNSTDKKINEVLSSPLQKGKRHKDTKQLKKGLAKIGYTVPGNGTTLFGKETEKKVKQFQKDHKLPVSGIAEDTTLAKIAHLVKNEDSKPSKPVNKTEYTNYNLTLDQALDIQMSRPTNITDKYSGDPAYVSADYLDFKVTTKSKANVRTSAKTGNNIALKLKNGTPIKIVGKTTGSKISGSKVWYRISYKGLKYYIHSSMVNDTQAVASANVNVRSNENSKSHIFGQLKKGQSIRVVSHGSWHQVSYGTWRNPTRSDMKVYLAPSKNDKFQHLRLDSTVGVSAQELNKVLKGKGILTGEGQAFINGANKHGVNEAYLMSHAFLETGNGTSSLANGVKYKGKTVYNMFGIGAVDSDPINGGAKTAYENGWFTPAKAIEGGAKWIGNGYIYNEYKQNTLYKMRWNPRMSEGYAWKQYATDIAWATKQVSQIKNIYSQLKNPNHHFDIPKYK